MSVNYIQIQVTAGFLMTPNWALGGLLRLKITKTAFVDVAGLGLSDQKMPQTATTPIAIAFKICISRRKSGLLNRLPGKVSFLYF